MMETIVAHAGNKKRCSREQAGDSALSRRPETDHCFCIAVRVACSVAKMPSAGCGSRKKTVAGTRRKERDAPIPAIRVTTTDRLKSDAKRTIVDRDKISGTSVTR